MSVRKLAVSLIINVSASAPRTEDVHREQPCSPDRSTDHLAPQQAASSRRRGPLLRVSAKFLSGQSVFGGNELHVPIDTSVGALKRKVEQAILDQETLDTLDNTAEETQKLKKRKLGFPPEYDTTLVLQSTSSLVLQAGDTRPVLALSQEQEPLPEQLSSESSASSEKLLSEAETSVSSLDGADVLHLTVIKQPLVPLIGDLSLFGDLSQYVPSLWPEKNCESAFVNVLKGSLHDDLTEKQPWLPFWFTKQLPPELHGGVIAGLMKLLTADFSRGRTRRRATYSERALCSSDPGSPKKTAHILEAWWPGPGEGGGQKNSPFGEEEGPSFAEEDHPKKEDYFLVRLWYTWHTGELFRLHVIKVRDPILSKCGVRTAPASAGGPAGAQCPFPEGPFSEKEAVPDWGRIFNGAGVPPQRDVLAFVADTKKYPGRRTSIYLTCSSISAGQNEATTENRARLELNLGDATFGAAGGGNERPWKEPLFTKKIAKLATQEVRRDLFQERAAKLLRELFAAVGAGEEKQE